MSQYALIEHSEKDLYETVFETFLGCRSRGRFSCLSEIYETKFCLLGNISS